jgi:CubicO group peptidase (beta-lactamase class C family)
MDVESWFRSRIEDGTSPGFCVSAWRGDGSAGKRVSFAIGMSGPACLGGRELDIDMRFNIGSVTKPVVAMLIAMLVEDGEMTIEDPIQRYVPEYVRTDVLVRHLLNHTAGYDGTVQIPRPSSIEDRRRYLDDVCAFDRFIGGLDEAATYYTFGYSLLMDLLERVAGTDIESFAQERLFKPAGMIHTTFDMRKPPLDGIVLPWNLEEGRFMTELAGMPPMGDSGLLSKAEDLVRLGRVVLDDGEGEFGRVVTPETAAWLSRDCTGGRFDRTPAFWLKGARNAAGCFGDSNSSRTLGHTGFSGCLLFVDLENRTVGAVASTSMHMHLDWTNYQRACDAIMAGMASR